MSYYHYLLVHGCNNVIIDQLTKQISKVDICTLYTIVEDLGHSVFLDRAIIQLSNVDFSVAAKLNDLTPSSDHLEVRGKPSRQNFSSQKQS